MLSLPVLLLAAIISVVHAWEYPEISREALLGDQSRYWASSRHFDTQAEPQVREFNFDMSVGYAPVGGMVRRTLLVNGMSPGPIIEANVGDQIVVHVHNSMPNGTAVHWHGIRQVGTNFMDGAAGFTQCPIPPGGDFTYNFTVFDSGTYWWHSHVELQYTDGAFGGMITHAKDDPHKVPAYDDDLILLIGDVYNTPTPALSWRYFNTLYTTSPLADPLPDGGQINGVSQANCAYIPTNAPPATPPVLPYYVPPPDPNAPIYPTSNECGDHPTTYWNVTAEPNKTYRLRLVNTGTHTDQIFSIDDHDLTVIEIDATPVEPYHTKRVRLTVGQRASVLIHTDKPGAHWIRSALGLDQMAAGGPNVSNTTLAVLRYGCDENTMPSLSPEDAVHTTGGLVYGDGGPGEPGNPAEPSWSDKAPTVGPLTRFVPVGTPAPPPSTQTIYTELSVGYPPQGLRIQTNNRSWTPMEGADHTAAIFKVQDGQEIGNGIHGTQFNMINTDPGAVIDIIIQTPYGPTHPFHLHGHNVWVMAQGQGKFEGTTNQLPTENIMYRDVFVVPGSKKGAYLVIRFKADNPGVWPFHCHMQWHMMMGLLSTLTSLPDQMTWDIPGRELCTSAH
ncbi:hypothetical protein CC85DRAFT_287761 [Cutaneotrichosporon oleaginosum]|uniref:Multicopper oxidase n=1 Tax=Cutaneotrichosporon oleaginosum TaxID=879819 RepID=A0A0J0XGP3_9TREE|nr:uncharacterized protein CC85DRAFT_287761 [Cutaneotrichosporon oleaginosum]KLT40238.1 hypothetical protein CC85DRAFT_287761 [Cutaneotrichosporon oleaginosum]TXT10472.1 hypothetical protein COLE_04406 [Cutaneotrichosporon oleaginosum]